MTCGSDHSWVYTAIQLEFCMPRIYFEKEWWSTSEKHIVITGVCLDLVMISSGIRSCEYVTKGKIIGR